MPRSSEMLCCFGYTLLDCNVRRCITLFPDVSTEAEIYTFNIAQRVVITNTLKDKIRKCHKILVSQKII